MKKYFIVLIAMVLLLALPSNASALDIKEISNECVFDFENFREYCEVELEFKNINISLSEYKQNLSSKLETKQAYRMRREIENTIIFVKIEWNKDNVKIGGYIKPATQNYFGIKGIYNSTWLNSSFDKRKPINMSVATGVSPDYLQVKLNITYDGNMSSDFDDLRFSNANSTTGLDYWIEQKVDGSWVLLWLEVDTPINTTNRIVANMYYDCPTCSAGSNIKNTWIVGDDFEDSSLNTTLWNITQYTDNSNAGSIYFDEGGKRVGHLYINLTDSGGVTYTVFLIGKINMTESRQIRLRTNATYSYTDKRVYFSLFVRDRTTICSGFTCSDKVGAEDGRWDADERLLLQTIGTVLTVLESTAGNNVNAYHIFEFAMNETEVYKIVDGVWELNETVTHGFNSASQYPVIFMRGDLVGDSIETFIDWFVAGKFYNPEPTYIIGSEEEQPVIPPPINLTNVTILDYNCIGNYSVFNQTLNNVSTLVYTTCDNGCNENNPIITVFGNTANLCNPSEYFQDMILLIWIGIILLVVYVLRKRMG